MITWSEAMFQKWYALPNGQGALTTYSRVGWRNYRGPEAHWNYPNTTAGQYPDHPINEYRYRVERLVAQLPIAAASRIIVLGCGSGFLPEAFIWWKMQRGVAQADAQAQVCGSDNSAFIQGNITAEAHALMSGKVSNRDMRNGTHNAYGNIWGGVRTGDFVIIESVDESYTPAERTTAYYDAQQSFLAAGRSPASVIHIVADGWDASVDGGSAALSLQQWAATRPGHSWASYWGDMPVIAGTG